MKLSTQSIVGGFFALGAILQVPSIDAMVLGSATKHPHIAAIVTAIVGIATALHNPQVQKALGLEPGDVVQATNPEVTPDGTLKADSATIIKNPKE